MLGKGEGGSCLGVSRGGCLCCSLYRKHQETLKLERCVTPRKMSEVLRDPPAVIRRKTDIAEVGDSTGIIMHLQKPGQQQSAVGKTVKDIGRQHFIMKRSG